MESIAHIRQSDGKVQTIEEHLSGVKTLSSQFGSKIGVEHIAGLAGMLHDMGKYSNEFRDYILEAVNNPESPPKRGSVDHSTAGGKLLYDYFHTKGKISKYKGILAEIVGNAILSHHSYLQDYLNPELGSNYLYRVRDKDLKGFDNCVQLFFEKVMSPQDFKAYVDRASAELERILEIEGPENYEKTLMFLTKFIFSALIDADRTNTRLFEENKSVEVTIQPDNLFEQYYEQLMAKIHSFSRQENAKSPINFLRSKMSDQCDAFAEKPSGIYTLSIPTGGGKTLASLRYALKHAILYRKKRIIYVVPYTTIIEQNAEAVRNVLNDQVNILEHHSNVIEDSNDDDERQDGFINRQQKLKLAKDNWDSPIIFTTMVQFLNVFYAKGSRNVRRLHNLSEAVIVFDEVQKVPISCVSLFNESLNFLKRYCHSSIVLCTATQPALDFVENKLDINTDAEIIDRLDEIIEAFKRVEIIDKATEETYNSDKLADFILEKMKEVKNVLVVLNTKSVVKRLYHRLKENDHQTPIYHLSTSMCPAHRNKILEEVRQHLDKGRPIICISTQLIEAGVDISFDCVIRSVAGLDSIAQAAGRCNRHGEKGMQRVYVIDHEEENLNRLKEIQLGKRISKKVLTDLRNDPLSHGGNILSQQAMERYFKEFYTGFQTELNYPVPKLKKNMTDLLIEPKYKNSYAEAYLRKEGEHLPLFLANSYKTAADHFKVIDDMTTTVIVPYEEGKHIIAELNSYESIEDLSRLLRKAQQYTINLYENERKQLEQSQGLKSYLDGKIFTLNETAYSQVYGLNVENDSPLDFNSY